MLRRITNFHQDHEQHWVADLECGHAQHVRHDPPLRTRAWVLTEATRHAHLGTMLNCIACDASPPLAFPDLIERATAASPLDPYEDARAQGLCHDGASEVVRRLADGAPRAPGSEMA
ncbi:MAG: DUF3565 domain-containing protein [Gemmatimonadales bacterium]